MKKIGLLLLLFVLLTACGGEAIEHDASAGTAVSINDNFRNNPIDMSLTIPQSNENNEAELLGIQCNLVDAWRNEMIHAYRELRELLPEDQTQEFMDTQMGFETYLWSGEKVYTRACRLERGKEAGSIANQYKIKQYRLRTEELVSLYNRLSPVPYEFIYPDSVDTVLDAKKIPVTFTEEDFDMIRKRHPYSFSPFLLYNRLETGNGFLGIDKTAGKLETYLNLVIPEQWETVEEIPERTNDFLYLASVKNTGAVSGYDPYLKLVPIKFYPIMKEHILETAKYLFGEDCEIDFDSLHDMGNYPYSSYFGIASMNFLPINQGYKAVVTRYEEFDDHYEVEVVFLFWTYLHYEATPTDYFYQDGNKLINLTLDEAKEYCQKILPRYKIQVNRKIDTQNPSDEKLFFVSMVKTP